MLADFRSLASCPMPTSSLAQEPRLVSEWKYMNGLRHVTYGSLALGSEKSGLPSFGWIHASAWFFLRVCTYAFQVRWAAMSWFASVSVRFG